MAPSTAGPDRLELFDGAFFADPYPAYAALREHEPVRRVALPDGAAWLLTRHADARAALADPRLSRDWRYTLPVERRDAFPAVPTPMLILMDPPDHTRLRRLVTRAFTARRTADLQPRAQRIADDLVAALPASGTVDLMRAYAFRLPAQVLCELLGVPAADRDEFDGWAATLIDDSGVQAAQGALGRLTAYLGELIERKRVEPDDALLSSLVRVADADGDRLSDDELVATATMLLIAGHDPTVNLIGNGVLALLTHPDQLARLRAEPGLVDAAVEEALRWDSPVAQSLPRFTTEDVTYSGVTIPAGERVLLVLGAANRDERWVADASRMDIGRDATGGIGFGQGQHFCLGAQLARIEARVAIGTLVAGRPELTLAAREDELVRRPSSMVRGLVTLPVHAGPHAPGRS